MCCSSVVNAKLWLIVFIRHFWLTNEQDVGSRLDEVQCSLVGECIFQDIYLLDTVRYCASVKWEKLFSLNTRAIRFYRGG